VTRPGAPCSFVVALSFSVCQPWNRQPGTSSQVCPCFMLVWGWVPSARVPGLRAAADATVTRRLLPAPSGSSADTGTSPTQVDFPVGVRKPRLLPATESCMVAGQGGRAPHDAYLAAIKTHFLFCHDDKHWAGRLATGKLPSPEPHPNSALTPPATEGPVLPSRPTLTLTLALTPARAGECRAHIHGLDRAMHDTLSECPGDRGPASAEPRSRRRECKSRHVG